ncbi:MAG: DNA-processing protein DprA [Actinomycetota bacterium]
MPLTGEDRRSAIRLATLPGMTPGRLRSLLRCERPAAVERRIIGDPGSIESTPRVSTRRHVDDSLLKIWRTELATARDPHVADGQQVYLLGDADYPWQLAQDPSAPALLFALGSLECLSARRVGIIGTRHATAYGRSMARSLGRALADHGVGIVSGLARGIDVSAHRGAFDAEDPERGSAVAVVASGLDVVYPPEHREIWNRIAVEGVLLGESPPGTTPLPYRFPLRNRIIAALSEVVVVVESKVEGGSMITVRHALRRGVTVMAVPGATSTPASAGTNLLLRDGASIVLSADDVLCALDLDTRRRHPFDDLRPRPTGHEAEVLALFGADPLTLDDVVALDARASNLGVGRVAMSLGRLEAQGWIGCTGGWFERLGDLRT